jgi:predicted ATPase
MSKALIADIGFVENREISERKVMISEGCDISELIKKSLVNVQSNQQRYILTGGPGAGKTSIINCLAQKGYFTVPEAATQIIEEDLNKGIKQPWRAEDYHLRMYKLILRRQMEVQQSTAPIAFFDRGHLDGLSYILLQKRTVYQGILDCIQAAIDNHYFSNKVFFIDSLGFVVPGPARDEDLQESLQKARCLEKNYKSMGYEIVHIPPGPVEERAQMIIDCIIKWGKNE